MSNNIGATPGVGDTIAAQDISQGTAPTTGKAPAAMLYVSANGTSAPTVVTDANPLPVAVQSSALPTGAATAANQSTANASLASIDSHITKADTDHVTVSAALPAGTNVIGHVIVDSSGLPSGASTAANQATGNTSLSSIDGKLVTSDYDTGAGQTLLPLVGIALPANGGPVQGGTSSNPVRTDPVGTTTQPVSIAAAVTVIQPTGTSLHAVIDSGAVSVSQATAASLNATVVGTGTFTVQAQQSGSWTATVTTNADATAGSAVPAHSLLVSGSDGTNARSISTTNAGVVKVDLSATAGNATAVKVDGSAVNQPVTQSGTWTVQPGNTANTTAWLTTETPSTTNGLSMYRRLSTADTNLDTAKASAGRLYSGYVSNTNANPRFLKIYDKASNPVLASDTPKWTVMIPGNASGVSGSIKFHGLQFSSGIAIAITGAVGDTDTTAISANEVIVNLGYK
jgi:hypothetical protein